MKSDIRRRRIVSVLSIGFGNAPLYSPDAEAVFARMNTPLSEAYKAAINTFINTLGTTQWAKVLEFWLWANDTSANSLIGWKGVVNSTITNSPTHSAASGFTTNGTNQYIGGFIPNTHAAGYEAKLACGCFIKENLSTGNTLSAFGTTLAASVGRLEVTQTPGSAAINMYANNNTVVNVSEGSNDDKIFDSETQYTIAQLAGTAYFYKDGIQITTASRANNGLSTVEMTFGAANINGTKAQHINAIFSAGWFIDPTGFDFRGFHLALKTMLTTLGVYSTTPELTIPTGGEWFDFSQAGLGTFVSLAGRKAALTALAAANAPNIEVEAGSGVRMARFESANSEAINLASVFQTFYDGTLPSSFSILVTVKPIDGSPASEQAFFGHTNGNNQMYARLTTANKVKIGFKEAVQAAINTNTDFAAFNNSPSNVTILLFEFLKDEMIVEVNGVRVNQTEDSWGTRALTDFDGGSINMYLGAENVDGVITRPFDGFIGDFMIRRGAWSQSQKERLYNYFS